MVKNLQQTDKARIKGVLRQLFLSSKERSTALKRDNYTCQICLRKASKAKGAEFKVQVHHLEGIENWDVLIEAIRRYLLCDPKDLQTLCRDCHLKVEGKEKH